jgi:hypothetical protein
MELGRAQPGFLRSRQLQGFNHQIGETDKSYLLFHSLDGIA